MKIISIRVPDEIHKLYVQLADQKMMKRRCFATELFVAALERYSKTDPADERKVL